MDLRAEETFGKGMGPGLAITHLSFL